MREKFSVGDKVIVVNKNSDLYLRKGRILMVNDEYDNAYVIIDEIRYLLDTNELMKEGDEDEDE